MMAGRRKEIDTGRAIPFENIPLSLIRYAGKALNLESLDGGGHTLKLKDNETFLQAAHRLMFTKSCNSRKILAEKTRSPSTVRSERTVVIKDTYITTRCEGCNEYEVINTSPMFGTVGLIEGLATIRATERCLNRCPKPKLGRKCALRLDLVPVDRSILYISQEKFQQLCHNARVWGNESGPEESKYRDDNSGDSGDIRDADIGMGKGKQDRGKARRRSGK